MLHCPPFHPTLHTLQGELDYAKLKGDTGPLVYPAGFVYLFAWLRRLTGSSVAAAQVRPAAGALLLGPPWDGGMPVPQSGCRRAAPQSLHSICPLSAVHLCGPLHSHRYTDPLIADTA